MTDLRPSPELRTFAAGPPRDDGSAPAGRVLLVMVVALVLAALFNSDRFVHAAEGMPYGWQRSALLAVARPVDDVAEALQLDRPRAGLDRALGRRPAADRDGDRAFTDPLPSPRTSPQGAASPLPSESPGEPMFRDASAEQPLRLFITGDSMIEFMAPRLIAAGGPALSGQHEVRYGTGLVRDDVFDWPAHARTQMAARTPEAVVMLVGGNDGQNIQLPDGRILQSGSPEWQVEYRRRAAIMMRILGGGGARHVYWVGMPPARSERLTNAYRALNAALAGAARDVPGATYVDIWTDFAPQGRYTEALEIDGRQVLVRARDGIHVNKEGAALLARKLHAILDEDWALSS